MTKLIKPDHKVIYLIPDDVDSWLWCEDPSPDFESDCDDAIKYYREDNCFSFLENKKRDALIMANARQLIKKKAATSNRALYRDLFGTGFTTAGMRCVALGLNPDSNVTDYNEMMKFLDV